MHEVFGNRIISKNLLLPAFPDLWLLFVEETEEKEYTRITIYTAQALQIEIALVMFPISQI
jgi:hypothetical protein